MSINERIKLIVDLYYGSQAELASDLGVSRVAISGYINSERKPNTEVYEKFYNLGFNLNWLVSGIGSMKISLLNREVLDKYDSLLLEESLKDRFLYSSVGTEIKAEDNLLLIETLLFRIRLYEDVSPDVIKSKIEKSKYYQFILNSISTESKSKFISFDYDEVISIRGGVDKKNRIDLKLLEAVDEKEFILSICSYLFLITEYNYYKKIIAGGNEWVNKRYQESLNNMDNFSPMDMVRRQYHEKVKEHFISLYEQIDDFSYIESKATILSGLIPNIFNIQK